jgi:hypothetical protein
MDFETKAETVLAKSGPRVERRLTGIQLQLLSLVL